MRDSSVRKKEKQNKKMRITAVCAVTSAVFVLIVFGVLALAVATPDREKSESENRVLKQFPAITLSSVFDGSFMKSFETYFNDQFPLRDKLIAFKSGFERMLGKTQENGVYIGRDNFLFEEPARVDSKKLSELTGAVAKFSQSNKRLKKAFILSPNSSDILPDKLPEALKAPDRGETFSAVKKALSSYSWIDCKTIFEKQKEKANLFYRTDHHWTTRAAYLAFKDLSAQWGLGARDKNYSFYTVSDSFRGTLSSTAAVNDGADKIEICVPKKQEGRFTVLYEASGRKTATFFEKDKLLQKNQY